MNIVSRMLVASAIVVSGVGCGGAVGRAPITVVRQHATGGELALHGPVVASHHAAEDEMLAHCRGRAEIVAVVRDRYRRPLRTATTGDVPSGAERLHYVCMTHAARLLANRGAP